jgi:hypothetical protein
MHQGDHDPVPHAQHRAAAGTVRPRAEDDLAGGGGQQVLVTAGHPVPVEQEQQVEGQYGAQPAGEGAPRGQVSQTRAGVLERLDPDRGVAKSPCSG